MQLVKLFYANKAGLTLLLHHSVIQLQQNKCPQGVAVLPWSRSKHSAHLMPEVAGAGRVVVWLSDTTGCSADLLDFKRYSERRKLAKLSSDFVTMKVSLQVEFNASRIGKLAHRKVNLGGLYITVISITKSLGSCLRAF